MISKYAEDLNDEDVIDKVFSLFEEDSLDRRPQLKSWTELREALQNKYFSLTKLQEIAENLLQAWNRVIFDEPPILMKLNYRLPDGDSVSDSSVNIECASTGRTLQSLKRKREILGKYHGEDPLEESIRIGAQARRVRVRDKGTGEHDGETVDGAQERRVRVRYEDEHDGEKEDRAQARRARVRYEETDEHNGEKEDGAQARRVRVRDEDRGQENAGRDDDEEDTEHEASRPLELSGLPPRKKKYVKVYGGVEPDEDVYTPDGRVKKRRPFTEREVGALKKGVAKFGKGSWAEIKQEYAEILRNRTTVQLKDKWRNMEKKGEDKD